MFSENRNDREYVGMTAIQGMRSPAAKTGFIPRGHDRMLRQAQKDKREIHIYLSNGQTVAGTVVANDAYTISIFQAKTRKCVVIYKSAIVYFAYDRDSRGGDWQ